MGPGELWAKHLREVREHCLARIHNGEASLGDVLAKRSDPAVGHIYLLGVLEAVPGARKIDTRRQLAKLEIAESAPIGELSGSQVELLTSKFSTPAAPLQD